MRSVFFKFGSVVLVLAMMLCMLTACGAKTPEQPDLDAVVDAAVAAALDAAVVPTVITIEADGQKITFEDASGKSVMQLLDEADIKLNDGDIVSIAPYQTLEGDITIQVLRKNTVLVVVAAENPLEDVIHTAVLMDGTVADAIAAVGIVLAEDNEVNYELDEALENNMEIIISVKVEEPEETEPASSSSGSSSSYSSGSSSSSSSSSNSGSSSSGSSSRPSSGSSSSGSSSSGSSSSGSSSSGSSSSGGSSSGSSSSGGSSSGGSSSGGSSSGSGSSAPSRTVVNEEYYYDCDGSGHGVKIITYSDGTQEEVPF